MLVKSFQNLQEAELLFDRVEEYCQHIHNRQQETDPDIQIQPEGKELP
jgi:hypothetical protein